MVEIATGLAAEGIVELAGSVGLVGLGCTAPAVEAVGTGLGVASPGRMVAAELFQVVQIGHVAAVAGTGSAPQVVVLAARTDSEQVARTGLEVAGVAEVALVECLGILVHRSLGLLLALCI